MGGALSVGIGATAVLSLIIAVAVFRDVLARRFLNVGIEVTGDIYSQDEYDKKVKYLGLAWFGFIITWFGGGFTMALALAPPAVYDDAMKLTPWAVAGFAIGFTILMTGLFSSTRIKGIKRPVEDIGKVDLKAEADAQKEARAKDISY